MDRLVRARVLITEAESLGVTIEDLVAAAADRPPARDAVPTFAEYVDVVERAIGPGRTAETYRSYWRLAVTRLGDRPINAIGSDDFDDVLADAVARAQRLRPPVAGPGGSHVHHAPIVGLGVQLCPSSIATGTPQTFGVAS